MFDSENILVTNSQILLFLFSELSYYSSFIFNFRWRARNWLKFLGFLAILLFPSFGLCCDRSRCLSSRDSIGVFALEIFYVWLSFTLFSKALILFSISLTLLSNDTRFYSSPSICLFNSEILMFLFWMLSGSSSCDSFETLFSIYIFRSIFISYFFDWRVSSSLLFCYLRTLFYFW